MSAQFIFLSLLFITSYALIMRRRSLKVWFIFVSVATFLWQSGFYQYDNVSLERFNSYIQGLITTPLYLIGWLPALLLLLLAIPSTRKIIFTAPVFGAIQSILPKVSQTEQEALDAGTVGWDAELFSGKPDWNKLRAIPPITLTKEEQDFLDGPVEELCGMVRDYEIRAQKNDIPENAWDYMREKGFFGMLISKEYGGLGFSPQAQSLVVGKVASASPDIGVCVMVPNSLGPGELIEKFGTDEQKNHYLERLAKGHEIPCFALTGPTSGSDAATMRDTGIVCKQMYNGKETLGFRVTWEKRYITLGPKATLLGLAFKALDPDNILGDEETLGITCALIPADHPGVNIGRRHQPIGCGFPNGPNWGTDVFIPMDWVIGGQERVGQGWRMLMACLAVGRSISLPTSSAAGLKKGISVTSAYARIRKQFGIPIAQMEGIQEPLSRMLEGAYIIEAARAVTAEMVSQGEKPAVISALLKYQSTEWARRCLNDGMDIHAGKAVCDGPKNYVLGAYMAMSVGITVEGANILTRSLIVFGQGALRSHPYLYEEIQAAQNNDLNAFDKAFTSHIGFLFSNIAGAFFHNLTGGIFAGKPKDIAGTGKWYRQLSRSSRSFAHIADMAVGILGGGLKTKQRLTGRLADALSELYLMSCILKRFEDDGMPEEDRDIVDYAMQNSLYRFQEALKGVIQNFPVAVMRPLMRTILFPLGAGRLPASDNHGKKIVMKLMKPGEQRQRLSRYTYYTEDLTKPTGLVEATFKKAVAAEAIEKKLDRAIRKGVVKRYHGLDWFQEAVDKGVLTEHEAEQLRELETLVEEVIAVDHFAPEDMISRDTVRQSTDKASLTLDVAQAS